MKYVISHSFENIDLKKYVSTCTKTDESFFVTNDAPMNEYSDLSDFSDDE